MLLVNAINYNFYDYSFITLSLQARVSTSLPVWGGEVKVGSMHGGAALDVMGGMSNSDGAGEIL